MNETTKQALLQELTQLSLEAKIADQIATINYSTETWNEYLNIRAKCNGYRKALYTMGMPYDDVQAAEAVYKVTIEKTA